MGWERLVEADESEGDDEVSISCAVAAVGSDNERDAMTGVFASRSTSFGGIGVECCWTSDGGANDEGYVPNNGTPRGAGEGEGDGREAREEGEKGVDSGRGARAPVRGDDNVESEDMGNDRRTLSDRTRGEPGVVA